MNHPIPETLEVDVFRAGDYGERGRYDEAGLDALAADYDPGRHEAPVTLDHRQDGPADGWVRALHRIGDRLVATLDRLSPRLRGLLATGGYRKRSVELYRRFAATGRPYVKAVSFLGAAAPAVKGMPDPVFAVGDEDAATDRFDETGPAVAEAASVRRRLMDAGRWNPAWTDAGIDDVLAALAGTEHLGTLAAFLEALPAPVAFGESLAPGREPHDDALALFVGTPSTESVELHRRVMAHLAAHPGTNYAEALACMRPGATS